MIETVYSNDNEESNRINRVLSTYKMPKNIRQVGKSSAVKKIYVEDYVMTFIKQLAGEDYSICKIAVLVGQYVKTENCRNIFVYGALEVENIDTSNEIVFSNDIWTSIYEDIKKYFTEAEIVGWFLGGPGYLFEDQEKILKAHIDNFAGQDKTLLTYDNMEKEEAFLIYENSRLNKQEGYYIYYEKNEEMQTYMIEHNKKESEEANYDDRVSKEIRAVIQNKKSETEDNKSVSRLMYAAGTLLAVIILVVGAAMLSNYDQMKNMQSALNDLSKNLEEVESIVTIDNNASTEDLTVDENTPVIKDTAEDGDKLSVEVVSGNVKPLEEDEKDTDPEKDLAEQEQDQDQEPEKVTKPEEEKVAEEPKDPVVNEEVKYYVVESGDSLVGICFKLYNSADNINEIMELNQIEDEDMILIGQRLIVP